MKKKISMSFWQIHSPIFCLALLVFPRLALLLWVAWGGILWWLGLIFFPRFLIAFLATRFYFETNPFLCGCAWLVAIFDLWFGRRRVRFATTLIKTSASQNSPWTDGDIIDVEAEVVD
jgi:hypothetical protein